MTRPPLLRLVHLSRRSRAGKAGVAAHPGGEPGGRRHGFDVSPSHGRHCICLRCEQLARSAN